MARVLITRAADEGHATLKRLAARGHQAMLSPLLVPRPLKWEPPAESVDAVMLTSARAAAWGGVTSCTALPCFAVGPATAAAARRAGFVDVREGPGRGAAALMAMIAALPRPPARLLHLAGRDRTPAAAPPGIVVEVRETYAVDLADLAPGAFSALAAGGIDWAILYSPRTARWFRERLATRDLSPAGLSIAALSPEVATAAGTGWKARAIADRPTEAALFAAAGL